MHINQQGRPVTAVKSAEHLQSFELSYSPDSNTVAALSHTRADCLHCCVSQVLKITI